jgi:translation initiation factor 4A
MLDSIDITQPNTQAIVLAPTRELAEQIHTFLSAIGQRMTDLKVALYIGGVAVESYTDCHVAVCTPGRAAHLIESGLLRCENIRMICLDEADKLLGEDFIGQIQMIVSFLQPDIQILLFSATYPSYTLESIASFIRDPVRILVLAEKLTLEGIRQFYVTTDRKFDTLLDIYANLTIQKAVIFANSKSSVDQIQQGLTKAGFAVSPIHSGLADREQTMRNFRLGLTRVLIATDLLGRGIDVQQITLVINYELPEDHEQYIHRIGRSARYGRKGVVINLCSPAEFDSLKRIEDFYHTKIEQLPADFGQINIVLSS